MTFKLRTAQANILADFCKDVAKGIVIAVILGQTIQTGGVAIVLTLSWVITAIIFLLIAMKFSQHV